MDICRASTLAAQLTPNHPENDTLPSLPLKIILQEADLLVLHASCSAKGSNPLGLTEDISFVDIRKSASEAVRWLAY